MRFRQYPTRSDPAIGIMTAHTLIQFAIRTDPATPGARNRPKGECIDGFPTLIRRDLGIMTESRLRLGMPH